MCSSRVAHKVKHVRKANNGVHNENGRVGSGVDNSNRIPLANTSETGFLLLNAALEPLYANALAGEILFHPEEPSRVKDFADQLASKIRTMITNGGSNAGISICEEFVSGSRHYVCRLFDVRLPGNNSKGSNESSLAILLERGPGITADILKICHEYHLSRREEEAVRFLVQGLASKEIAARMKVSSNTVKVFLRFAMMKMGVSSRSGIMSKFIHLKA